MTVKKYHINPESGNVSICSAKIQCKFQKPGGSFPHFDNKEDAQKVYEAFMEELQDPFSAAMVSKNPDNASVLMMSLKNDQTIAKLTKEFEQEKETGKVYENYNHFSSDSSVLKEYNNDYAMLKKNATEKELEALNLYTAISYEPVNNYLRSSDKENYEFYSESSKSKIFEMIESLDSYIDKAPRKDRTVFRVVSQGSMGDNDGVMSGADFAKLLNCRVGEQVSFGEYLSTTIDAGHAAKRASKKEEHTSVAFVISTSQGAPVGETLVDSFDAFEPQKLEREILLPRNTTFKVNRIERAAFSDRDGDSYSPMTVFLEEVEQ